MGAGTAARRTAWRPATAPRMDAVTLSRADEPGRRQRFWAVEPAGHEEQGDEQLCAWSQDYREPHSPAPAYPPKQPGVIEIVLWDGVCVRVDSAVDAVALRRVLDALQGR